MSVENYKKKSKNITQHLVQLNDAWASASETWGIRGRGLSLDFHT